jgi:GrpB protein
VWLRLRAHGGRRATLVDLYELEAARQGIRPEELSAADRQRLKAASLHARRDQAEVVPGSARGADPHEVTSYDPDWPARFQSWRDRLAAALGRSAVRIDHVGSTSVPGLAMARWCHDRKAYGDSKTDFVLDTLADAAEWAIATGWRT